MKKNLLLVLITSLALFACKEDSIPAKYYTVSFVGENINIESQSVEHGKCVIAPENPEREYFDFVGWFTDNGTFANRWEFATDVVIQNTTLYAKWEGNYPIEIPRIECEHEGVYIDTTKMEGIACLFVNTIPVELKKEDNIMYIIYNKEDNLVTYSLHTADAFYEGNICNFPDFAKEWEIPIGGKQIYYEGELYVNGIYWSAPPYISGDLILTVLK
ncbi:InlB B-repeat-containing protein [Bacteroidales bacterium OttesenSCG-928-I14]|nr:InlB B-repeat-containing protein [Bacteroidales bacterium OttesenSCG-928-I14]